MRFKPPIKIVFPILACGAVIASVIFMTGREIVKVFPKLPSPGDLYTDFHSSPWKWRNTNTILEIKSGWVRYVDLNGKTNEASVSRFRSVYSYVGTVPKNHK
jgi:hypothetical protein